MLSKIGTLLTIFLTLYSQTTAAQEIDQQYVCSLETMALSQQSAQTSGLLVFAEFDHSTISWLQFKLLPRVRAIIQECAQLSSHLLDPAPRLILKKRQNLTLYSLPDHQPHQERHFLAALEMLKYPTHSTPKSLVTERKVHLLPKLAFFGDKQDEIVILVDGKSLEPLHNLIKTAALSTHKAYKTETGKDLFDAQKADRFHYVPHIPLGRIDFGKLEVVNQTMVAVIKIRIEQEVFPLIDSWLSSKDIDLDFNDIYLYDATQKLCIKNYNFAYGIEDDFYTLTH